MFRHDNFTIETLKTNAITNNLSTSSNFICLNNFIFHRYFLNKCLTHYFEPLQISITAIESKTDYSLMKTINHFFGRIIT